MPLDLWQRDAETAVADAARSSAPRLPIGFEEAFGAAWDYAEFFSQSTAGHHARQAVLSDIVSDIHRRTGVDLSGESLVGSPEAGMFLDADSLNRAIAARKAKDPAFAADPIPDAEIDQRTLAKSREAVRDFAAVQQAEKTAGGRLGSFLGGLAGGAADPVNVLALPVAAPESLGLLGTALAWGAIGAGTQAVSEAVGAPFRERVQPGYLESGRPFANILETGLFAAGTAGILKGAANVWERVATGQWPRSVRDAGNVVASEDNLARTNVLHGAAGEVAHREALTKTIDDVLAGRAVDVDDIFARSRTLIARLESETGMSLPIFDRRAIELLSEDAALGNRSGLLASQLEALPQGVQASADRLARVREVERQMAAATGEERRALTRRRDELLADTTPERLAMEARPIELRRAAEAERDAIAARRQEIASELAQRQADKLVPNQPLLGQRMVVRNGSLFDAYQTRIDALVDEARSVAREVEQGRAERAAAATERAPELPFAPTAADARAETHLGTIADGVQQLSAMAGRTMPREEAERVAKLVADAKSDTQAYRILSEVSQRPHTVADLLPTVPRETPTEPLRLIEPAETAQALASPEHQAALRSDIDRARAMGDVKVPIGLDERGEPIFRSVDAAVAEVDAYKKAAEQIQACVNPVREAAE